MPERMGEWTLLGHGSDPVVADTAVVSDRVAHYRDLAEQMQTNAVRLDRIGDGSALQGKYADELRSSSRDVAKDLHQVVGRYQAVASALEAYEPELESALAESLAALDDAVAAKGAGQAADGMPTATAEEGKALTPDQTAQNDAKTAATNRAADALSAAKVRLGRALDALDGAGRAASSTINGGFHDGLKDSGWDRFVYAFMKFLKILVKVLTYIAMALAVIALVIPGLGEIIFAAAIAISVVDVAANAALVAGGEGSWADFGIAIAGLLTFGVGKLFGPAIQAGLKSIGNGVKSGVNGALDTARGLRGGPRPAVAGDGTSPLSSGRSSFSDGSGTGGRATTADDFPSVPTHEPRTVTADDFPSVPTHEPRTVTADDFPSVPRHEPGSSPAGDVPSRPATPEDPLVSYTGGGFERMNQFLRGTHQFPEAEAAGLRDQIAAVTRRLDELPDAGESWTYRGLVGDIAPDLARGGRFTDPGFISTTSSREKAWEFIATGGALNGRNESGLGTLFHIQGTGGREVSHLNALGEGEILYGAGTTFEVDGVKSVMESITVNGQKIDYRVIFLRSPGLIRD